MALKSGLAGQIGYATESTPGTGVTVTRFVPAISENIVQEIERVESEGILTGQRVLRSAQWAPGRKVISGDIQHELYSDQMGLLFKHMFGGVSTSGAGPYTHTFTPGDLTGVSFTTQVGRPGTGGTVHPFTYAGCKVASWELGLSEGEIAALGLSIVAMSETTATALASASYASGLAPYYFTGGAVTIQGSSVNVKQLTLSGDNGLDVDRRFLGSATMAEPLEADLREYLATLELEFEDLTQYSRFVAGTEHPMVLTLTAGTDTLTITTNVRFDGQTPALSGRELLSQSLPVKCVGASTDAGAITAVMVNSDATP